MANATPRGNTLLSIWNWTAVLLVSIVGFFIQLLLWLVTIFDRNRRLPGRWYRIMGYSAAAIGGSWRFSVVGPLPASPPRRAVVVSNHQSQADPFLISRLPWEMKWLGKKILFRIPFVGWCMWLAGDIPLVRGDRGSAKGAMDLCATYLQRDMPVMIFPEGTRSRDRRLLPFKSGAFRLAIENQADVLPVAVAGTHYALPKGSWKVGRSRGVVVVGEPISTVGMTLDDVDRLSEMARTRIEELRLRAIPHSSEAGEPLPFDEPAASAQPADAQHVDAQHVDAQHVAAQHVDADAAAGA